ncbi:MAG: hypothetical protein ABJL86_01830 [Gilvibacter sp.]
MYLYKAIDAYPYDLQEAVEALNYALSYEPNNAHALFLMGRLYAEQLQEVETAIDYYEAALASEINLIKAYPHYLDALIKNEMLDEAQKFLDFAMTVNAADKPLLIYFKGITLEKKGELKAAIKTYKCAKKLALNGDFVRFANAQIERVKGKMPKKKKSKKKKKKSNKNKKKGDKK